MKTITLLISIFTIVLLGSSCVGPRGYDGIDGQDGKDGIANVGAAIYDVEATAWDGNIDGFTTSLIVPEIDQNVYENGAVLVYMLRNDGTENQSFNQLPYTWLNNSITEYFDFDAFIGRIDITLRWVDNGVNNTEAPSGLYSFKVIVIEGTPLSVLQANTDISNPEAVLDYMQGVVAF